MKKYLVGGAVRDMLLGIESKDRDWVVVGSTPEEMKSLGYQQVGSSFPVFLHPETGEEYALARTERKTGAGYHGFTTDFNPSVTLEEDLERRDLTINSMALDVEAYRLIDPFGGQEDLHNNMLRHTSNAFAEDPVRVLRTARFAARYQFEIYGATEVLMAIVAPELEYVSQERVWKEFEKGLMEIAPERMIRALKFCEAMKLPCMQVYANASISHLMTLPPEADLITRLACVIRGSREDATKIGKLMEKAKIPSDAIRVITTYIRERVTIYNYTNLNVFEKVALFDRLRAFSDPEFCLDLFNIIANVDVRIDQHNGLFTEVGQMEAMAKDMAVLRTVDAAAIAASVEPKQIKQAIFDARVGALQADRVEC